MTRGTLRTLHKWIFIFMGAFILIWCLSGVLMVLPQQLFGESIRFSRPAVDYRNVTLSPAGAIARLRQYTGHEVNARRVELLQIHYQLLYRIEAGDHTNHYIDALSGRRFEFTPALAEDIARNAFGIRKPAIESTRLTEHDKSYPLGQLPVYRVRFEAKPDVQYYVNEANGRVTRSTTTASIRNVIMALHALEPVEQLTHNRELRRNLLVLTGTISLLGAVFGYILTLPAGRKGKQTTG